MPIRHVLPFSGVSRRSRGRFYVMLAQTLEAGIPVLRALEIMAGQTHSSAFRGAAIHMRDRVREGETLAKAMEELPGVFPAPEVRMIEAAERAGRAPLIIDRLGDLLTWASNTQRTFYTGLIYPAVLLFTALVFLPVFTAFFLGGLEDVLLAIAWNAFAVALYAAGIWMLWKILVGDDRGRYWIDRILTRTPLIGPARRKMALARFARMLEILYGAGISLRDAVRYAALGCGNEYIARRLLPAEGGIAEGLTLAEALRETHVIPSMGMGMIEVGEQSGGLEISLRKYTEYEEQEVMLGIELMAKYLPLVIYGLVAAYLVFFVILPAFQSYFDLIGQGF